jgi:hypothetical protein
MTGLRTIVATLKGPRPVREPEDGMLLLLVVKSTHLNSAPEHPPNLLFTPVTKPSSTGFFLLFPSSDLEAEVISVRRRSRQHGR